MVLTLYSTPSSPPARAVDMTVLALNLKVNYKEINVLKQEHLTTDFCKLNPQHTIPVLDDDGVVIWDSHAIIAYLIGKYGKDDSLYPQDLVKRAQIDQRLHFDTGVAFSVLRSIFKHLWIGGNKTIPQAYLNLVDECYDFMEKFLDGRNWLAGDSVTIADISLLASITSLDTFIAIDPNKYPKVKAWIARSEKLPFYEANKPGLEDFSAIMKSLTEG